ncbi:hypothetical protein [Asticcacaulis benevestitus]|uniref:Uncharacterized protein n=1 Tax=Asticcacaulis benevestitus DSM 16100 = ATCC BAA-896 TaxID=1121022 RepID=V4R1Z3_9CAUL|nr:hypothetical protein [Asticcacaulis benevestitus]ESQ85453.1 hypothetical protein ABENE_18830 [Asticcacaulis benevestitus DSM 16100 = ATCC BAA-896]
MWSFLVLRSQGLSQNFYRAELFFASALSRLGRLSTADGTQVVIFVEPEAIY